MLVPTIVKLADNHWHKILQESLVALKTILKEIDTFAFEDALKLSENDKKLFAISQSKDERAKLDKKWSKLDRNIKNTHSNYETPLVPFSSSRLTMEFNSLYKKVYDKERFVNQ